MDNNHQDEVYFTNLINIVKKRKFFLAAYILSFCLVGVVYALTAKPVFETEATILIGTKTADSMNKAGRRFEELDPSKTDYYKTQYAMLKSRSLAKRVIDKLKLLEEEEEFKREESLIDLGKIMAPMESFLISFGFSEPKPEVDEDYDYHETQVVDAFLERLIISPVRESHVVHIGFEGFSPVLIKEITNTFLDEIIKRNIDRRSKILGGSEKWMKEKLIELKGKMAVAERRLANFRKKNNIIDYKKNREITAKNLSRYQDEIRKVKTKQLKLATSKVLLTKLKADPAGLLHSLPDDFKTLEISRLIKDYSKLLTEYNDLTPKYSLEHPRVQQLHHKVKAIEKTIPKEIDRLISSIDIDYRGTVDHEESLKIEKQVEKETIMKLDNEEFTFNQLTDEFESNKILHNDLLKRFKEIDIASFSNESAIQIVDRAGVPYIPVKPKKVLIVLLCFVMGFLSGVFIVFILSVMKKSVIVVEDVIRQIPFPFLGATGVIEKKDLPLPVVNDSNTFLAEEFRTVKTNLMMNGFVDPNKVLMVSSATPSEGKTTIITNLAATFAQDGKRVLVIEADFTRPQVARILEAESRLGLLDILSSPKLFQRVIESHIIDSKKIDKVFVKSPVEGVYVLPKGNTSGEHPDILNYGVFEKILTVTRKIFDVVLIDTPPALAFSYISVVAQLSDGVLFVIGSGMKDKALITKTLDKLAAATSPASFKGKTNGHNGRNGQNGGQNGQIDSNGHTDQSKIYGVVLNKVKYKRDEHYMYHRKYFQEYYASKKSGIT